MPPGKFKSSIQVQGKILKPIFKPFLIANDEYVNAGSGNA
jgi:hypothetical protein